MLCGGGSSSSSKSRVLGDFRHVTGTTDTSTVLCSIHLHRILGTNSRSVMVWKLSEVLPEIKRLGIAERLFGSKDENGIW